MDWKSVLGLIIILLAVLVFSGVLDNAIDSIQDKLYKRGGWLPRFVSKKAKNAADKIDTGECYPIENSEKPSGNVIEKRDMTEYNKGFECGKQRVLKYPEEFGLCKNSAWSEEDISNIDHLLNALCGVIGLKQFQIDKLIKWLKSLKDRVKPQNLTITDEELVQAKKEAYNDALDKIEYHSGDPSFDDGWSAAIWYLKKREILKS